jgi:hypothetical protein
VSEGIENFKRPPLKPVQAMLHCTHARVAELVDAHGSGPCIARCGDSSSLPGTKNTIKGHCFYSGLFVFHCFPLLSSGNQQVHRGRKRICAACFPTLCTFFADPGKNRPAPGYNVTLHTCPGGGIGRRARFRSVYRKMWRFEFSPGHQIQPDSESWMKKPLQCSGFFVFRNQKQPRFQAAVSGRLRSAAPPDRGPACRRSWRA